MTDPSQIGKPPTLEWTDDGRPRAAGFGDTYYAPDPVAESQAVFVEGCGLLQAWAKPGGPARIGETGFGAGLNFLLAWAAWKGAAAAPRTLDFVSVEAFPMDRAQLEKAHGAYPQLEEFAQALRAAWPDRFEPGLHQFHFEQGRVRLSLIIGDAVELGRAVVPGGIEAWFLDGFAPSRNPGMWRPELFEQLARQSAPGARLASFTAAGAVRRGLEAAGFAVTREPGFGGKRHRITARLSAVPQRVWWFVETQPDAAVEILGAGVAGLCAAHALRQAGIEVSVCDPNGAGSGASGNRAALFMPRLFVGGGAEGALLDRYYTHALGLWRGLGVLHETGVDQFAVTGKEGDRFARYAAQNGGHSGAEWDDGEQRLHHARAGWLDPHQALAALLDGNAITPAQAGASGVLEAAGAAVQADDPGWPVAFRAGQTLCIEAVTNPARPVIAGEFVIPLNESSAMVGASFTPHGGGAPPPWDEEIEQRLIAAAERLGTGPGAVQTRWSGVRVTLPDRLPALGPVGDDPARWRVTGLGARGFVTAPLLGALFADCAAGRVLAVPSEQWAHIHAGRFAQRTAKRK